MTDHYHINIFWSDEDQCFVAMVPDLRGCSASGDTPEQALAEVQIAKRMWIELANEIGRPLPEARYRPLAAAAS